MAFKELGDALTGAHLDLPIKGKTYRIDDPDWPTVLMVRQLFSVSAALVSDAEVAEEDVEVLDDGDERDLYERLLGDAYGEMQADGLGGSAIKHCAMTVMAWILGDEEAAEQYWNSGGGSAALGEVLTGRQGNRAARRASEAAARKTNGRGSTSGTSPSRRGHGGRGNGRSRGTKSSNSGR